MVAIIDYDAGNLANVERALRHLGADCRITREQEELKNADHLVLPGVGSFGDAMEKLKRYRLTEPIRQAVEDGKPLLGICLGLQLLFESSEESPGVPGLGLLPGRIARLPGKEGLKIPHIGWNSLSIRENSCLFAGIPQEAYVYFVHSYYLQAERPEDVAATAEYGAVFHAAVEHKTLCACQFHPEKSGEIGLQILKNFLELKGE